VLLNFLFIPLDRVELNTVPSQPKNSTLQISDTTLIKSFIWISISILIASILPLWVELEPIQYPNLSKEVLVNEFMNLSKQILSPQEQDLISANISKDDVFLKGVAFYPRFYIAGDGEPTRSDKNYMEKDYPRLMLVLIGSNRSSVEIPIQRSPAYFPNASEVIVIGHQLGDLIRADYVLLTKPHPTMIQSSVVAAPAN
jgi:hypothetical protein